jgi:hypothetical protein
LPFPGIETQFLGHPVHGLVSIPTKLSFQLDFDSITPAI